jgi:hypothetical protein
LSLASENEPAEIEAGLDLELDPVVIGRLREGCRRFLAQAALPARRPCAGGGRGACRERKGKGSATAHAATLSEDS